MILNADICLVCYGDRPDEPSDKVDTDMVGQVRKQLDREEIQA